MLFHEELWYSTMSTAISLSHPVYQKEFFFFALFPSEERPQRVVIETLLLLPPSLPPPPGLAPLLSALVWGCRGSSVSLDQARVALLNPLSHTHTHTAASRYIKAWKLLPAGCEWTWSRLSAERRKLRTQSAQLLVQCAQCCTAATLQCAVQFSH